LYAHSPNTRFWQQHEQNFKLRKWCSNDPGTLKQIPDSEKDSFPKSWYRLGFNFGYSAFLHIAHESSSKIQKALGPVCNCSLLRPLGLPRHTEGQYPAAANLGRKT